jgi:hypothetical protein
METIREKKEEKKILIKRYTQSRSQDMTYFCERYDIINRFCGEENEGKLFGKQT